MTVLDRRAKGRVAGCRLAVHAAVSQGAGRFQVTSLTGVPKGGSTRHAEVRLEVGIGARGEQRRDRVGSAGAGRNNQWRPRIKGDVYPLLAHEREEDGVMLDESSLVVGIGAGFRKASDL